MQGVRSQQGRDRRWDSRVGDGSVLENQRRPPCTRRPSLGPRQPRAALRSILPPADVLSAYYETNSNPTTA